MSGSLTIEALRAAHEAQIEALTAPGLSDAERVDRFAAVARFEAPSRVTARTEVEHGRESPAYAVWCYGCYELSLFADLPGCNCPVVEKVCGNRSYQGRVSYVGIPIGFGRDWAPTLDELKVFARVQQRARFPEGAAP